MFYMQCLLTVLAGGESLILARRAGKTQHWWVAFSIGLTLVITVLLARRVPALMFLPPMVWLDDARISPAVMAAAIPLLLLPLITKLPERRRPIMRLFLAVMLTAYSALPLLAQAYGHLQLPTLKTVIDNKGVCRQSTPYSCGPAAAVTCLKRLGKDENEGSLADAAGTGPLIGTSMTGLARVLNQRHRGVNAHCATLTSPLNMRVPAIADMTLPRIGGHYVAVLRVSATEVELGDPLSGHYVLPREEFEKYWNHTVIIFGG